MTRTTPRRSRRPSPGWRADDRELVELKIYAGLTFREIAAIVDRPAATVGDSLSAGRWSRSAGGWPNNIGEHYGCKNRSTNSHSSW